jgi:PEP-CTERM motif
MKEGSTMPIRLLRALIFCAVLSLMLTNTFGQNPKYWNQYSGNWSAGGNWNPIGVPGPSDDVVISHPFGDIVTLDSGTATINSLTLGGSYGSSVSSVLAGDGTTNLSIMGDLTIGQTGDLELRAGDVINHYGMLPNYHFLNLGLVHVGPGAQLNIGDDQISTVYDGAYFNIEGTLTPNYFVQLATIQPAGTLALMNGQHWVIDGTQNGGTLTNSGGLVLGNGTKLDVYGNVVNNGTLATGGGHSYLSIYGSLTNNRSPFGGSFEVGSNDTADLFWLTNNSYVTVGAGGTLNLVFGIQPGITDIPANSGFAILGTFNQTYNPLNPSAFYNLTSIEGGLLLGNGQTTDIAPGGGTLLSTSGYLNVEHGSTLNIHGTLNNSDPLSQLYLFDSGTVVNVDNLNNNGLVWIDTGSTLFLLNQPNGITTIPAVSQFVLDGECYAGATTSAPNCFYKLDTVDGGLVLNTTQTIDVTPAGGTLTISSSGFFEITNGTNYILHGNLDNTHGGISINDPGPTTLTITGTLTNLGGYINVFGPQAVLNAGSIVNGGMLSLPEGSKVNVANGFYQLDAGTLGEAIGASCFSILVTANGQVMLAGTLDIMLDPGFNPSIGSTYRFLLFQPGELSGMFASIQNDYFNGSEKWIVIYNNADGYVELQAAPAPEPASFLLLGSGLLSVAFGLRRKFK